MEIEIIPDLSSCIQTLAKKEYEKVLRNLLREEGEESYLEKKLEILRIFLESADFHDLRNRSEKAILEGGTVRFKITLDGWKMETDQSLT
ncbi:MAG: hypothetical protein JW882_18940 [Deltaproteobacteria bacterium]|nr:hypothetical protein [Deltaproteobacteria bacterium]